MAELYSIQVWMPGAWFNSRKGGKVSTGCSWSHIGKGAGKYRRIMYNGNDRASTSDMTTVSSLLEEKEEESKWMQELFGWNMDSLFSTDYYAKEEIVKPEFVLDVPVKIEGNKREELAGEIFGLEIKNDGILPNAEYFAYEIINEGRIEAKEMPEFHLLKNEKLILPAIEYIENTDGVEYKYENVPAFGKEGRNLRYFAEGKNFKAEKEGRSNAVEISNYAGKERIWKLGEAYAQKGRAYYVLGEYAKSYQNLEKAIKIFEKYRGSAVSAGKVVESKLNKFISDNYVFKGMANMKLRKTGKAIKDFEKAVKTAPENAFALFNKGKFYYEYKKEYRKAIKCLKEAINIEINYAPAYYLMAKCYQAFGNAAKAKEYYRKAEEIWKEEKQKKANAEKKKAIPYNDLLGVFEKTKCKLSRLNAKV
ncbi:MAG: tetratricopeptide repeat protein [Candidatus Micrarchaeota archaeon]